MEINRSALSAVIPSWVTTANIGNTGVDIVMSAQILVPIPSVPIIDYCLEIKYTQARTAGTGTAEAQALISFFQGDVTVASQAVAASFITGKLVAITARSRIVRLKPSVLQAYSSDGEENLSVYVRGWGSAADTVWTITDIGARLIYVPA